MNYNNSSSETHKQNKSIDLIISQVALILNLLQNNINTHSKYHQLPETWKAWE